jgi:hypothetical protein
VVRLFNCSCYNSYKDHVEKQSKPLSEQIGYDFTFAGMFQRILGFLLIIVLFQMLGQLNGQECLLKHYLLLNLWNNLILTHIIVYGILMHAMNTRFHYTNNYLYVATVLVILGRILAL